MVSSSRAATAAEDTPLGQTGLCEPRRGGGVRCVRARQSPVGLIIRVDAVAVHGQRGYRRGEPGRFDFQLRRIPARSPRVTNLFAILRLASSIISSPNITAPLRSPSVVAFS